MSASWHLFSGKARAPRRVDFPPPPPWRDFSRRTPSTSFAALGDDAKPDAELRARALAYRVPSSILDAVNAALLLRRPLLVTGRPGAGKSSLIYRVAFELALGPVRVWPVNSRSTLREGLYEYDALTRLQDRELLPKEDVDDIGRYITLGPLGTALLPSARPRALLVDELDKADPDLPNDLLNVFEEGWFDIPELVRHGTKVASVRVKRAARSDKAPPHVAITHGHVQCTEFPFVVLTSNGERDFPPAFLRRCIRAELPDPDADQLRSIVEAHLGSSVADSAIEDIRRFAAPDVRNNATDQLLNALHLVSSKKIDPKTAQDVIELLTRPLA